MSATTLLAQVRKLCILDADTNDFEAAEKYAETAKYCEMTSNQALVYGQAVRPDRLDLVRSAIRYVQEEDKGSPETFELDVLDVLTVKLGKEIYPLITGNLHAQTTPSVAYDTEKTIEHAKKLVSIYEAHGIPKNRVCIKIPTTGEGVLACKYLATIGIQTLATAVFSVPQAVAASQAGCIFVAPYFNELRVHFEPSLWKDYELPGVEHPLSPVIRSIILTLKALDSKTKVMPASIVTSKEVIGLVSLNPDHITLSASVLEQLAALPAVDDSLFECKNSAGSAFEKYHDSDFLANGGAALRVAIETDEETARKMKDALLLFGECEDKARAYVRSLVD